MDEEYYCPNCGAILNDQFGFDPDNQVWVCEACGKQLYGDDVYDGDLYPGVMWYCDECGELLNKQIGFMDYFDTWTCQCCGHENRISQDEIEDDSFDSPMLRGLQRITSFLEWVADMAGADRETAQKCESPDEHDEESEEKEKDARYRAEEAEQIAAEQREKQKVEEEERIRAANKWKRLKAFILSGRRIEVGTSSNNLVGRPVDEVVAQLTHAGFKSIETEKLCDEYPGSNFYLGEVDSVAIGDVSDFEAQDTLPYSDKITVFYHWKKELPIPIASRQSKKLCADELADLFKEGGFTQVDLIPQYDLTTGWLRKAGTIVQTMVDGSTSFKEKVLYPYDIPICITYHAFKRDAR